ncbi:MAG: nucleotidyl transferase AbiEii/AbiGii toxin family protein [Myxococcota bacterium]
MTRFLLPEQAHALRILAESLAGTEAYLAGGIAVATHLSHRSSRDLDLFTTQTDPHLLEERLLQHSDVKIMGRAEGTLYLEVAGVPTSLILYPYPALEAPVQSEGMPVPVASVRDLVCMKLSAVSQRGAMRDLWDVHDLLTMCRVPLSTALEWFERKYQKVDVGHVVRSLVYFADAEAEPFPVGLTKESWALVKRDLRAWVEEL